MKLSAVVIAKNEEDMIADCLDTLNFCDEIVYVDDGSTDRTYEIAKRFTDKVFKNPNKSQGYVEAVRKFGVSQSMGDFVLIIDADERVTKELAREIKNEIQKKEAFDAYNMFRQNFYLGNNPWPKKDIVERLFKKKAVENWDWKLHTSPLISGDVGMFQGILLHYTHRDLSSMLSKTIEWSRIEAEIRYKEGHPKMTWWRFPRVMATSFFDYYVRQGGFKVGTAGLVESVYQAFSIFVTYAKLWELQKLHEKA